MKAPEEADNIKLKQRITSPHDITEKTEEKKPGKGLGEYKNIAPLYSNCDNCERSWAPTSNSLHHKNIKHVEPVALIFDIMPWNKRKLRRHMFEGNSDHEKLTCKSCGKPVDEEKDLRVHVTSKHENNEDEEGTRLSASMVSIITMTYRMIESHENKLGPSWAKLRHNWDLML